MKTFIPLILAATLCSAVVSQAQPKRPIHISPRQNLVCATTEGIKAAAGEIVLSGTIRSVDAATNQITMTAQKFSLPTGKTGAISPFKPKVISAGDDTFIHYEKGNVARLNVQAFVVGASVDVVGKDGGSGRSLQAREVVLGLPSFVTEIETLKVRSLDGGKAQSQDMTQYGQFSNDAQLFWRDGAVGNALTLEFDSPASGNYSYELSGTKAFDYGIVRISINGVKNESGPIDLYNREVVPFPMANGTVPLVAGTNVIKVEIVGRNPAAYDGFVGLDSILCKPAP